MGALLLRLRSLGDSLNGDELATYFVVVGHGLDRIVEIVQSDQEVTPPLYPVLARFTRGIGSTTDGLRWIPLLAGVGSIPLTYLLGIRTVGRRPALVAAAVMALSPFLIFYSSEARPYSLMMLLCLGSSLALLKALEGRRARWWVLYGLLGCAAMWSHYTAVFVLFGQFAWALVTHAGTWRPLLLANVAAAIGYLPWLSSYKADQDSPGADIIGTLQPFGLGVFKTDVLHWSVGHPIIGNSVREMPGRVALALMGAGLLLGTIVIAVELARRETRLPTLRDRAWLVLVLALSTPVIAGLYSAVSVSVFLPRNLIASWPGLALVFGVIVAGSRRRSTGVVASLLLLVGFAIGAARMQTADSQRPDYKSVASFIESRGGRDAITVDSPGLSPGPLSQLDVTLAPGQAMPRGITAYRLGRPSREAQLRAARPGGPGQFAPLPVATPEQIASRAATKAGRGDIFLVTPGSLPLERLRRGEVSRDAQALLAATPVGGFLKKLPPRFRLVEQKTVPGFFGLGTTSVYVLRGDRDRD